jgi:hypothetical protein
MNWWKIIMASAPQLGICCKGEDCTGFISLSMRTVIPRVEHAAATNVIVEVACEQVYSSNGSNLPQTRSLDFTYNMV